MDEHVQNRVSVNCRFEFALAKKHDYRRGSFFLLHDECVSFQSGNQPSVAMAATMARYGQAVAYHFYVPR